MRGSLVVPTLNEGGSIGPVLREFRQAADLANANEFVRDPIDWELLVVDGGSTDGTVAAASVAGARVLAEPRRGYGRAYLTGFAEAQGEVVATMDGDATYPGGEIPRLVRHLLEAQLDFVSCDRLTGIDRKAMTTEHRVGNWMLNAFLQVAYHRFLKEAAGGRLRDSQSGMWVFRREILRKFRLTQTGMAFSEELKLEVLLHGLRFEEVPIRYAERWGAPKLSSWRDGRRNLAFLLAKRFEVARELRNKSPLTSPQRSEWPRD